MKQSFSLSLSILSLLILTLHLHYLLVYASAFPSSICNLSLSLFLSSYLNFSLLGSVAMAPPWLEAMLKTAFFSDCKLHEDSTRKECNLYCLDCNGDAFCFYCKSSKHRNHQVIQIRRSSYHNVVRVSEIQKVTDISGVQTYVINGARVLFLNERPHIKFAAKGTAHICEICRRNLSDPFRFCSLGCKAVGVRMKKEPSFCSAMDGRREEGEGEGEGGGGGSKGDVIYPLTASRTSSATRRRKGIPRRAPFGS